MSFFIKCMAPNYQVNTLYCIKDRKPHRLNHPKSLDRDWFVSSREAAKAKADLQKRYSAWQWLKFVIERH